MERGIPNGTPSKHCGNPEPHERHASVGEWCDGVPPLEPFLELTVRASVRELFGDVNPSHQQALHLIARYGLGMLVDCIEKPETARVLRVRTGDGVDKVYPLLVNADNKGFKAVVDAPGF